MISPTTHPTRMPTDDDTYLYYNFQETSPPFADQGSAGIPLQDVAGLGVGYQGGVRGSIFGGRAVSIAKSATESAARADGTAVWTSTEITLSVWTTVQVYAQDGSGIAGFKSYSATQWDPPYYGIGLTFINNNLEGILGTSGGLNFLRVPWDLWAPLHSKLLLGVTYDGAEMNLWVNGIQADTTPLTETMDLGAGPWGIGCYTLGGSPPLGGVPAVANTTISGVTEEFRVCEVARDADWWLENWRRGSGTR